MPDSGGVGHVSEAAGRLSLWPSECRPLLCGAEQVDGAHRRRQLNASGTSDLNDMGAMAREMSISLAGQPVHAAAASWLAWGRAPLGNHVAGFDGTNRGASGVPDRVGTLMEGRQRVGGFFGPIRGQGHTMAAVAAVAEVRGGIRGVEGIVVDDEGGEEGSREDNDERKKREGRRMNNCLEENRRDLCTPVRGDPFQPRLASNEGLDGVLLAASHESFLLSRRARP